MKKRSIIILVLILIVTILILVVYLFFPFQKISLFIKYPCPVPKKYCRLGKIIRIERNYIGIGYRLPENTSMLAIVDGASRGGRLNFNPKYGEGTYSTIVISQNGSTEVDYIYSGKDFQNFGKVAVGEEIGKTTEGAISDFDVNLIIRLRQNSPGKSEIIELTPANFK